MILDRRLPSAVTAGPRSPNWPQEAARQFRRFACPDPEANDPGQDAPRAGRPGDELPCLARMTLPITCGCVRTCMRVRPQPPIRSARRGLLRHVSLGEPNGGYVRRLPTCPGRPRSRWTIGVSAGPDRDRCLPDRWEIHQPPSARVCLPAGDRDRACCVLGEGNRPFTPAFPRPIRAPDALVVRKRAGQSGAQQRPPEP
jgi:hypothetical protein